MNLRLFGLLLFLMFALSKPCWAIRIESNDLLLFMGKEYRVDNRIFHKIFKKLPEIEVKPVLFWVNADKNYTVHYEVIGKELWITALITTVGDTTPSGRIDTIYANVLPSMFNGKQQVHAHWLSCEMYCYTVSWRKKPFSTPGHTLVKHYKRLSIVQGQIQQQRYLGSRLVKRSKLRQYHKARKNPAKYEFDTRYAEGGEMALGKQYMADFTTLINFDLLRQQLTLYANTGDVAGDD